LGVGDDLPGLKGGCHEFALSPMEVPFAVEKPVAKDGTERLVDDGPLIEVVGMLYQDAVNQLRGVEQNSGERAQAKAADVTTLVGDTQHEAQAVFVELGKTANSWQSSEALDRLGRYPSSHLYFSFSL